MAREADFFDRLYSGYAAEYYVMGVLYRHNFDCVRPPADMGVDIVAVNLRECLVNPDASKQNYYLQVKSQTLPSEKRTLDENKKRYFFPVELKIKTSDLKLLCSGKDRALVCCVYNKVDTDTPADGYETPFLVFWMDGMMLKSWLGDEVLGDPAKNRASKSTEGEKVTLLFRLYEPKDENTHWYVEGYKDEDRVYLGAIGSDSAKTESEAKADHYSIGGYLEYARRA